jgi:hypothetical protein
MAVVAVVALTLMVHSKARGSESTRNWLAQRASHWQKGMNKIIWYHIMVLSTKRGIIYGIGDDSSSRLLESFSLFHHPRWWMFHFFGASCHFEF